MYQQNSMDGLIAEIWRVQRLIKEKYFGAENSLKKTYFLQLEKQAKMKYFFHTKLYWEVSSKRLKQAALCQGLTYRELRMREDVSEQKGPPVFKALFGSVRILDISVASPVMSLL